MPIDVERAGKNQREQRGNHQKAKLVNRQQYWEDREAGRRSGTCPWHEVTRLIRVHEQNNHSAERRIKTGRRNREEKHRDLGNHIYSQWYQDGEIIGKGIFWDEHQWAYQYYRKVREESGTPPCQIHQNGDYCPQFRDWTQRNPRSAWINQK